MPMSGAVLGAAMATAIKGLSEVEKASPDAIWAKLGAEIVEHIVTNGVVTTTGSATAQAGTIA